MQQAAKPSAHKTPFSSELVTLLSPYPQKGERKMETHHRSERLFKRLHVSRDAVAPCSQDALVPECSCPSSQKLSRLTLAAGSSQHPGP